MKPALQKSKASLLLMFMCCIASAFAQSPAVERLRAELKNHPAEDTIRVNRLNDLAFETRNKLPKESFASSHEAINISKKINYAHGEAVALLSLGFYHRFKGEFGPALTHAQQAMEKFVLLKDTVNLITCMYNISTIIGTTGDLYKSFMYSIEGMKLADKIKNSKWQILFNTQLGYRFLQLSDRKKAKQYLANALSIAEKTGDEDGIEHCMDGLGRIAEWEGKREEAMSFFNRRIELARKLHADRNVVETNLSIAELNLNAGKYEQAIASTQQQFQEINGKGFDGLRTWAFSILSRSFLKIHEPDSSITYGLLTIDQTTENGTRTFRRMITQTLGDAYFEKGNFNKAYLYQKEYNNFKDSLNETETVRNIEAIQFTNDLEKKQSEINLLANNQQLIQETNSQQKKLLWGSAAGIVLLCALLFFLWRNNIEKKKTNARLQQQQEELKATQSQLIQAEKMASLGELTAGIAHEIQNPLNFVNNFSEVSNEMLVEMKAELAVGNSQSAIELADDIGQNLEKINHHGKRADSIVKGMLQHSRTSTGHKEPTEINALADEYMKLAYHGLRAKDKNFNVTMITDFDTSIGKINVIPQDIGRVLLNLYNNAFYAVNENVKSYELQAASYEPRVSVSTKKHGNIVLIVVEDNGKGIPQQIIDKIFQPFFTTKPTGQGTGLGLSLAYDIVKAHGGELKVESRENEGTTFSVLLPA